MAYFEVIRRGRLHLTRTAPFARQPRALLLIAVVFCVLVGAVIPHALSASIALQFAVILLALTAAIVLAVRHDVRKTGDWLSPLALSGAFYLLAYVGGPAYFWFNPDLGTHAPVYLPFDHRGLMLASGLCLLGWIFFALGYSVRLFKFARIPPLRLEANWQTIDLVALPLYVIGWLARALLISRGLYFHNANANQEIAQTYGSSLDQALYILSFLPLIAVAYAGIRRTDGGRLWQTLYWAGVLAELAYAAGSGARAQVMTVALLVLGTSFYVRRRFPLRTAVTVALIAIFVAFPVLYLYRASASYTQGTGGLGSGLSTYTSQGVGYAAIYGIETTFDRFSDIFVPAALVDRGRHAYSIAPGTTLIWALANPIPHALWPSKPSVGTFAGDLAQAIGLAYYNSTSVATTQIGDLFLNFGAIGMLGMVVVGSIYREIGEWLRERWRSPLVLALYVAMLLPLIETHEAIFAQGLIGTLRAMLVLAAFLWLLLRLIGRKGATAWLSAAEHDW